MRDFIADNVKSLKSSVLKEFFDLSMELKNTVSLGVGEPDFDTPWHIREEGIYSLEQGRTFYTNFSGLSELREQIALFQKRMYHLAYDPETEVLVTVGGSEAIDLALRMVINPKDEVIIPEPCYVSYEPCSRLAMANVVTIPLQEKNEFKLTKEELLKVITPKSKVLILPYPNNPTGAIMEQSDLEAIAEVCRENDLLVIADELYASLTYTKEHISISSIEGMKERTIVINGFSKAYAMTGWRIGYACGPKNLMNVMKKLHEFAVLCVPTTSQFAAIEALKNGDKDIVEMRNSYNQRRLFVLEYLKEMGLQTFTPRGGFYFFVNIKEFEMTSLEFCTRLAKEGGVIVIPGIAFGQSGEGFVRISYAYSLEDLKIALNRLRNYIIKLRNERR